MKIFLTTIALLLVLGVVALSGIASDYNDITLNADGLSEISEFGVTQFDVRDFEGMDRQFFVFDTSSIPIEDMITIGTIDMWLDDDLGIRITITTLDTCKGSIRYLCENGYGFFSDSFKVLMFWNNIIN